MTISSQPVQTSSPVPRQSPSVLKIVTTSWDDGAIYDMGIARLLEDWKLGGTFYVPIAGDFNCPAMSNSDLRELVGQGFEVGAHGYFHRLLDHCGAGELSQEIALCKVDLQATLGQEVRMFAYPRGRYSKAAIREVRKAGYKGARTTRMFSCGPGFDSYKMPTTLQAFPHTKSAYCRNMLRGGKIGRTWKYVTEYRRYGRWTNLGMALFDSMMLTGGIWHLYGHSWEVRDLNLWNDLAELFEYISQREGVLYLSNSQVLDALAPSPGLTSGM